MAFLAKVAVPCKQPSDLRPIVLTTTACKIVTKILLLQLRHKFADTAFGQLCGTQSSHTLDGSLAAQQLIHLSDAYGPPLVLIKAAFDSLLHTAVARFLTQTEAQRLRTTLGNHSEFEGGVKYGA